MFFILDAMNSNRYFPNPNDIELHEALEKALKSLKTRKWRFNRKRKQQDDGFVPNQRRRLEDEVCVYFILFYFIFIFLIVTLHNFSFFQCGRKKINSQLIKSIQVKRIINL